MGICCHARLCCPKCGYTCDKGMSLVLVGFEDANVNGEYCKECFARKVAELIPRMVESK